MSKHRNDVQVIRGICLISIFIYHYNSKYLHSGFIGVDIFFMISGYVNALSFTNKTNYSYIIYQLHRATRLLPVSWVALVSTLYITSKMNIIYRKKLYLDILSADTSISNYRFIYLSTDYLSQTEKPSIILHYWSLSVEDQFYLLFPFFVKLLLSHNLIFLIFLISAYIISLAECYFYHSYSYFSMFSRIWEFLYGILITKNNCNEIKNIYKYTLLIIIVLFFFLKNIEHISPSISIIPLTVIIFILNNHNKELISCKVLQKLGDISYCFYLFHFILIYIIKEFNIEYVNIVICFAVTYILSFIFTIFYENPIRYKVTNLVNQITMVIFFHFTIISSIQYLVSNVNTNILFNSKNNKLLYNYEDIMSAWNDIYYKNGNCPFMINKKPNLNNVALFMTDSHVEQWFNVTMPFLISYNYIPIQVYVNENDIIAKDMRVIKRVLEYFKRIKIIIVGHLIFQKILEPRLTYFKRYVKILLNYTNKIYIIQDTPHFSYNPFESITTDKNKKYYGIIGVNASVYELPTINDKRITYINMNRYICKKKKYCSFVIKNIPVYKDSHHLTIQFASYLRNNFIKQFPVKYLKTIENNSKWYKCNELFKKFKY